MQILRPLAYFFCLVIFVGTLNAAQQPVLIEPVQDQQNRNDVQVQDQQDPADDDPSQEAQQPDGDSDENAEGDLSQDAPDDESSAEEQSRRKPRRRGNPYKKFSKQASDLAQTFSPVVASASGSVVSITDGKDQIAFGTIVDGSGLILTKASELRGELTCKLIDGQVLPARVLGIDDDTDLALLRVEADELPEAPWSEAVAPQVGSWLANVNQTNLPLSIGIVSHNLRKIANSKAMIGIYLEDRESGGVRITRVTANSPADEAGLLINDVIMGVDDIDTPTHMDLRTKLAEYQPGDTIKLKLERSGEIREVDVTLSSETKISPMMARGSSQDRMGSTLSRRRKNFPLALQHDSKINANQCGGPIVDLSGRVVGINIARDGRVSSLAIPTEILLPVVQRLKSGEFAPEVVNREELESLDQEIEELKQSLGDLPQRTKQAEIARSAAEAQQEELARLKREIEDRLEKVQEENKPVIKKAEKLAAELSKLEKKRQKLAADRKRLATGVR